MAGMNSPNPERGVAIAGEQGFIARNLTQHCLERTDVVLETDVSEASASGRVIFYIFDDVPLSSTSTACSLNLEEKQQAIARLQAVSDCDLVVLAKPDSISVLEKSIPTDAGNMSFVSLVEVFGKWAATGAANLVADACLKVSRHEEAKITFPGIRQFIYVDDLCRSLLSGITSAAYVPVIPGPVYEMSADKLAKALCSIRESRITQVVPPVGSGLLRALYATYISYLDQKDFSYPLDNHADSRGSFIEFLKTETHGQISCLTAKPGVTRGQHYHHSKCERFLVLQGTAKFAFRNLLNDEAHEITVSAETPEVVESIPGWVHNIKNIGTEELIVVLWANEVFNPALPDTNQAEM